MCPLKINHNHLFPQPLIATILRSGLKKFLPIKTYKSNKTVLGLVRLAYFTQIIFYKFTHIISCIKCHSLLRLNSIALYVCTTFGYTHGHRDCFYLWSIVNNDATNTHVHISVQVPAFNYLGCIPRDGISGSHNNSMFKVCGTCILFVTAALPFHSLISNAQISIFSTSFSTLVTHLFIHFFFFLIRAILTSLWGFYFHFSTDVEHLFLCLLVICMLSLEKCLFMFFVHF